jgi:hypothetical protein
MQKFRVTIHVSGIYADDYLTVTAPRQGETISFLNGARYVVHRIIHVVGTRNLDSDIIAECIKL